MDLDSAAQNLMETIIKVYMCLKTRSRGICIDRGSDYLQCYPCSRKNIVLEKKRKYKCRSYGTKSRNMIDFS